MYSKFRKLTFEVETISARVKCFALHVLKCCGQTIHIMIVYVQQLLLVWWFSASRHSSTMGSEFFWSLYATQIYKLLVAFFLNILKVVFLLMQGGPPPAPPAPPGGTGLSARRLCKICWSSRNRTHWNVEVYGRSEDETQRKCILQAEKHYAWVKKILRRTFISLGKTVFSPFGRKKQLFFLEK